MPPPLGQNQTPPTIIYPPHSPLGYWGRGVFPATPACPSLCFFCLIFLSASGPKIQWGLNPVFFKKEGEGEQTPFLSQAILQLGREPRTTLSIAKKHERMRSLCPFCMLEV